MTGSPRPSAFSSAIEIAEAWVIGQAPAMFPSIVRWRGDLVLAYSTVPDGWPGGELRAVRSGDRGRTWSGSVTLAGPRPGCDAVLSAISLTTLSDGLIVAPFNRVRWPEDGSVDGRIISAALRMSDDGGLTWGDEVELAAGFAGPAVYGQLVELSDGRLLWPTWGSERVGERWRSAVWFLDRDGNTIDGPVTVAHDPEARLRTSYVAHGAHGVDVDPADPAFRPHASNDGFSETSVARLVDGSLLAVLRQQGAFGDQVLQLFASRSKNDGSSWEPPVGLGFSGMSPLVHPLPDGRLLLFSRKHSDNPTARTARERVPGVEVRLGDAWGQGWSEPVDLVDPEGMVPAAEYQVGYPTAVTLDDGSVLVVFYGFREATGRLLLANLLRLVG